MARLDWGVKLVYRPSMQCTYGYLFYRTVPQKFVVAFLRAHCLKANASDGRRHDRVTTTKRRKNTNIIDDLVNTTSDNFTSPASSCSASTICPWPRLPSLYVEQGLLPVVHSGTTSGLTAMNVVRERSTSSLQLATRSDLQKSLCIRVTKRERTTT